MDIQKNIINLIELCIVKNSDAAWGEFIQRYSVAVRGTYFKLNFTIKSDDVFEEFKLWFPGWLYYGNKIQAAYRALRKKIDEKGLSDPEAQEKFFGVYFSKIIITGCAEFGRDKKKTFDVMEVRPDLPDTSRASIISDDDAKDQHRQIGLDTLSSLPPEQRVPFLLRYYDLVWPLEESDMKWAAAQTGIAVQNFTKAVEHEGRKKTQKYPLSSRFVGEILNIPPDINGKYVTVDQRVRRVLLKLKNKVTTAGEEVEP